jgi:3-hydroxybutyryl-CoA dehydrogenase
MEIGSVGIIGAGLMGSGIAEVCARNGIRTLVTEAGTEQLAAGQRRVTASLERGRKTGKLSDEDVDRINGLLTFTPRLEDFAECDFCVEAIVEQLPAKVTLFERLDHIVSEKAILATNTSALPIIEIARATRPR